MMARAA